MAFVFSGLLRAGPAGAVSLLGRSQRSCLVDCLHFFRRQLVDLSARMGSRISRQSALEHFGGRAVLYRDPAHCSCWPPRWSEGDLIRPDGCFVCRRGALRHASHEWLQQSMDQQLRPVSVLRRRNAALALSEMPHRAVAPGHASGCRTGRHLLLADSLYYFWSAG